MNFNKLTHHSALQIKGKTFNTYWSANAEKALQKRNTPLIVEMELKFACMVRMLVHFHDTAEGVQTVKINDKLSVFYRPVIGQRCDIDDAKKGFEIGELKTGPMSDRFPKKLGIDFIKGQWVGKYS